MPQYNDSLASINRIKLYEQRQMKKTDWVPGIGYTQKILIPSKCYIKNNCEILTYKYVKKYHNSHIPPAAWYLGKENYTTDYVLVFVKHDAWVGIYGTPYYRVIQKGLQVYPKFLYMLYKEELGDNMQLLNNNKMEDLQKLHKIKQALQDHQLLFKWDGLTIRITPYKYGDPWHRGVYINGIHIRSLLKTDIQLAAEWGKQERVYSNIMHDIRWLLDWNYPKINPTGELLTLNPELLDYDLRIHKQDIPTSDYPATAPDVNYAATTIEPTQKSIKKGRHKFRKQVHQDIKKFHSDFPKGQKRGKKLRQKYSDRKAELRAKIAQAHIPVKSMSVEFYRVRWQHKWTNKTGTSYYFYDSNLAEIFSTSYYTNRIVLSIQKVRIGLSSPRIQRIMGRMYMSGGLSGCISLRKDWPKKGTGMRPMTEETKKRIDDERYAAEHDKYERKTANDIKKEYLEKKHVPVAYVKYKDTGYINKVLKSNLEFLDDTKYDLVTKKDYKEQQKRANNIYTPSGTFTGQNRKARREIKKYKMSAKGTLVLKQKGKPSKTERLRQSVTDKQNHIETIIDARIKNKRYKLNLLTT